jgi:hypothetical protein
MLPNSERYAASSEQAAEVLLRQFALLTTVADDGLKHLVVVAQLWPDDRAEHPKLLRRFSEPLLWRESAEDPALGDLPQLWLSFGPWDLALLEPLLQGAAEGEVAFAITDTSASWLYAPYEGGVHVIFATEHSMRAAREKHRSWLPHTTSGL